MKSGRTSNSREHSPAHGQATSYGQTLADAGEFRQYESEAESALRCEILGFLRETLDNEATDAQCDLLKKLSLPMTAKMQAKIRFILNNNGTVNKLGGGTYGKVVRGILNGTFVAVKISGEMTQDEIMERRFMKMWAQEVCTHLLMMDSRYCVGLCGWFINAFQVGTEVKFTVSFVLEIMECNLTECLMSLPQQINFTNMVKLFRETLMAIKALHDRGITHNDVKSENVLIKLVVPTVGVRPPASCAIIDGCVAVVMISDFGLSTHPTWTDPVLGGTPYQMGFDDDELPSGPRDVYGWAMMIIRMMMHAPCLRDCSSNSDDAKMIQLRELLAQAGNPYPVDRLTVPQVLTLLDQLVEPKPVALPAVESKPVALPAVEEAKPAVEPKPVALPAVEEAKPAVEPKPVALPALEAKPAASSAVEESRSAFPSAKEEAKPVPASVEPVTPLAAKELATPPRARDARGLSPREQSPRPSPRSPAQRCTSTPILAAAETGQTPPRNCLSDDAPNLALDGSFEKADKFQEATCPARPPPIHSTLTPRLLGAPGWLYHGRLPTAATLCQAHGPS